jgi:hypothetical protein
MKKIIAISFYFLPFVQQIAVAQTNCKDIDLNKVPGKWVWKYDQKSNGVNNPAPAQLWNICEPITKELQRTIPQPPDGAIAHTIMTEGGTGTFFQHPKGPRYYQYYLMIKDYECIMNPGPKVQSEGETGCWIYMDVNNHKEYGMHLPGGSDVMLDEHRRLYLTSAWLQSDANGNLLLYTSEEKDKVMKRGFVFTEKGRIPYRKITRKELFSCYKSFHEKRLNNEIVRFEAIVIKNDQQYNGLTAAQKKEQNYWPGIIERDKKVLQGFKNDKEKVERWHASVMQQPHLNDTAYAQQIATWAFEPNKLDARPGEGNPVWVDDIDFYDRNKPINQPQYIFVWYRHQDGDLPKKNFMEKFTSTFNLDILWKMIGAAPRKPGGVNNILSSFIDAKAVTKTEQDNKGAQLFSFDNMEEGKYPTGWNGMKNAAVQSHNGSKWLMMDKDGYWFPRQYNKEIKDGFSLSFNLEWPEKIPYYSGLFTVTFSEIKYDNVGEAYVMDENQRNYWSFYDSYAGEFNRVALWFDPHWNNSGTLEVYSLDRNENRLLTKKITLPGFYKEKNRHQIKIERKGNGLLVTDNGQVVADIPGVFISTVRYNLYTFSKYKGNKQGESGDVFYLNNVSHNY